MVDVEVVRLLNQVILDYLSVKGLHHTRETFRREIFASQNVDAANSSQEPLLLMWWSVFCDTYNSSFFDFLDEENAVVNNVDANQSNVSDAMTVAFSPHLVESSPVMECSDSDSELSELLAKDSSVLQCPNQLNDMDVILPFDEMFDIDLEGPNLMEPNMDAFTNALPTSPQLLDAGRDCICSAMSSLEVVFNSFQSSDGAVNSSEDSPIVQFLDHLNETDVILPCAGNTGHFDERYGTNLEGPTLMEPNMHAPSNALPTPEFLDAAVNSSEDVSILLSLDQLNDMDVIHAFARNDGYGTNLEGPTLMEPNVHAFTNVLPASSEYLNAAVNSAQESSILQSLDQLNETDIILPFARNAGYGTNIEGPTLMEPNVHAPTNALPTSSEFLDAAVNSTEGSSILRSVDQLNDMDVTHAFARNVGYGTNWEGPTQMEPNVHAFTNALPPSSEYLNAAVNSTEGSSILRSLDQLNDMDVIRAFARNVGYGTNWQGPTLMEPNVHAPTNALPTSSEFLVAGNNRSLQQAPPQNWTSNALPDELDEYYANELKLTLTKYKSSQKNRTQGESSVKNARVFADINERASGKLLAGQPMVAPTGRTMRSYEKQPVVQIGKKGKTPLNSLTIVGKQKGIVIDTAKDNTRIKAQSNPTFALAQRAKEKDIYIKESHDPRATNIKLLSCHFDTQGEFLATAGHARKVLIWELGKNTLNSIEGHTHVITDVRFKPNSTVFATSSFDKTVKIWDAAKPNKIYGNLGGHDGHVMSVDYHPTRLDLLSSCDRNNKIRLWNVNTRACRLILQGGNRQVRFQSQVGKVLASSTENIINIFDIETGNIQKQLQGHVKNVRSICWDITGNYLASVSEDRARLWAIRDGVCIFELLSGENKFQSCTFHPGHYQALVIGSNKFLEFWNPIFQGNSTSSCSAHDGIISSLAESPAKNIMASVSYDQCIKIWS